MKTSSASSNETLTEAGIGNFQNAVQEMVSSESFIKGIQSALFTPSFIENFSKSIVTSATFVQSITQLVDQKVQHHDNKIKILENENGQLKKRLTALESKV
ncbi:unnamed protein product, partial [Didymodactylos carnosus]